MTRISIYSSALTLCAASAFALLFGCDNSKKTIVPPGITPKFLYAASCGQLNPTRSPRHFRPHKASSSPGIPEGTISGFGVDATTGALTALSGTPEVSGLECPEFMATDPAQKFLFVPDEGNDFIRVYAIGATGALTEAPGSPYDQCTFQLQVDSSGKFLVAPDFCNDNIDVYAIASDGSLTPVAGSPFAESSGNQPSSVFIDPTSQWVYVADESDGSTVSVFAMSSAGALSEISGSPYAAGNFTYAITGTPDGKYIYVNDDDSSNGIVAYSADSSTGALTPLATPTAPGGGCWLSVDATGTVLFSTDCDGGVFSSVIASDGTLTAATGSPVDAGDEAYPVTGDPSGLFVYAGNDDSPGEIFAYSYSSAGVLTPITGTPFVTVGTDIEGIVVTH